MKAMTEKVIFRMPGDELAAFKRRLSHDGITISVFLRTSIQNYLISNPRITAQSADTPTSDSCHTISWSLQFPISNLSTCLELTN